MYAARDRDDVLWFYENAPGRGLNHWLSTGDMIRWKKPFMGSDPFPSLRWEDEPLYIDNLVEHLQSIAIPDVSQHMMDDPSAVSDQDCEAIPPTLANSMEIARMRGELAGAHLAIHEAANIITDVLESTCRGDGINESQIQFMAAFLGRTGRPVWGGRLAK